MAYSAVFNEIQKKMLIVSYVSPILKNEIFIVLKEIQLPQ